MVKIFCGPRAAECGTAPDGRRMAKQLAQIAHEEATSTNGKETLGRSSEGILTDRPATSSLRIAGRKTEVVPLPESSHHLG